jgi:RNA polymerase sigma-70 factor (ECF subfamily)
VRESVAPLLGIPNAAAEARGTCPDVLNLLSQHLEGEVSAARCAEMERHLDDCSRCRGVCDSLKRTLALCRTVGGGDRVPAAVQTQVKAALEDYLAARQG